MTGNTEERGSGVGVDDEGMGIDAQLYKVKIEDLIKYSPAHIERDDKHWMRWYMPDKHEGGQTTAYIDVLGDHAQANFTTAQSTGLLKGLSAFNHIFGSEMLVLEGMDKAALYLDNSGYYRNKRSHVIKISNMPENESRVIADSITHAQITKNAKFLNIGVIQFTTILMLYALVDSEIIPAHLKQTFQNYIDEFEACMVIFFHSMGIERALPEPTQDLIEEQDPDDQDPETDLE